MAAICAAVFSLPMVATATLPRLPICAIHSRNAEMVISRPIIIIANSARVRSSFTSKIKATATINLSATGSRNAPKSEVCCHNLAKKPSNQSVMAAMTNTDAASQLMLC